MINLDEQLDKELINILLVSCNNYKNRIKHLHRTNRITDYKLNGLDTNLKNLNKVILVLNQKLYEIDNGR